MVVVDLTWRTFESDDMVGAAREFVRSSVRLGKLALVLRSEVLVY